MATISCSIQLDSFWNLAIGLYCLFVMFYHTIGIDTIPYDTGLEAPVRACSLLVVPEVLKRNQLITCFLIIRYVGLFTCYFCFQAEFLALPEKQWYL